MTVLVPARVRVDAVAVRRHSKGVPAIVYAVTDTPSAGSKYRLPPRPVPLEPETTDGARIAKRQARMSTAPTAGSETARPCRLLSVDPGQA